MLTTLCESMSNLSAYFLLVPNFIYIALHSRDFATINFSFGSATLLTAVFRCQKTTDLFFIY